MYKKYSALLGVSVLALLVIVAPFALVQPANAQFVIASTPDEYGQYIYEIDVYENSTGSWLLLDNPWHVDYQGQSLEWTAGIGIKLLCMTWFNSTLTGAATTAEGKLYQRHNVTVTNRADVIIFSQANFTYESVSTSADPMWYYGYSVVLNFLPEPLVSYTVIITYDVYYVVG